MPKTKGLATSETQPSAERICWTFRDPSGELYMQIREHPVDLCYHIYEWDETKKRTGETVMEWKPLDQYPWSLLSAVMWVMEHMVRDRGGSTDDIRRMAATVKQVQKAIEGSFNGAST